MNDAMYYNLGRGVDGSPWAGLQGCALFVATQLLALRQSAVIGSFLSSTVVRTVVLPL